MLTHPLRRSLRWSALSVACALTFGATPAFAAEAQIRGTLLVTEIDGGPSKSGRQEVAIAREGGRHQSVEVAHDAALTGKGVLRRGDRDDQLAALSGSEVMLTASSNSSGATVSQVQVLAAGDTAPPSGPQKVLTILAKFPGDTSEALSVDEARAMIYTGERSASDYYREASDGRVTFVGVKRTDGDVTPWVELTGQSPNVCAYENWRTSAIAEAKDVGFDFAAGGYDKLALVFNRPAGCAYFGQAPYHGDTVNIYEPRVQTVAHEFGHSFGLLHASSQGCHLGTVSVSDQPNATCPRADLVEAEYGDLNDVLGHGFRELSAAHKTQLGFLPAANTKTWTGESVVTLAPAGVTLPSGTTQQLKIPLSDGSSYQLETRRSQGTIDDYAADDPVVRGVLLRQVTQNGNFIDTKLVTTSADDVDWVRPGADNPEAPIEVGRSYYDARHDLTIETLTVTASATTVRIQRGPKAGAAAQVSLVSGELAVVDTVGRANDIVAFNLGDRALVIDHAGPLSAPSGCVQVTPNQISCARGSISSFRADLGAGDDVARLDGTNLPSTVLGGDGNDVLAGSHYPDTIDGGAGNDVLLFQNQPGDTWRCGAGFDRYDSKAAGGSVASDCEAPRDTTVAWSPIRNWIGVDGTDHAERFDVTSNGSVTTVTSDRPLRVGAGCVQQDPTTARCAGHVLETRIEAFGGDDVLTHRGPALGRLYGGAGDDALSGGTASELLDGGEGSDIISYADRTVSLRLVPEDDGITGFLRGGAAGTPERDGVVGAERIVGGSAADALVSDDAAHTLEGGPGNDLIDGGGGTDVLRGGDGDDDVLAGDSAPDTVDCGAGTDRAATDQADSRVGCETAALAEARVVNGVLTLATVSGLNSSLLVADMPDDYRASSPAVQPIIAGDGCTRVTNNGVTCPKAGVTSAVVDGGDGNDTLKVTANLPSRLLGGSGVDSLVGGPAADRLEGGSGADTITGGAGADTVDYSSSTAGVSVTLGAGADDGAPGEGDSVAADIESVLGSPHDDTIRSRTADDTLDGAGGNDTLTFDIGTAAAGVTIDLRTTSRQATGPAGADLLTSFERVVGTANADLINGTDGANVLSGGGGADVVWARGDADVVRGDDGDDTIITADDNTADTVDCGVGADRTVSGGNDARSACETAAASYVEVRDSEVHLGVSAGVANGLWFGEVNGYYRVSARAGQAVIAGRGCTVTSSNGAQCTRDGVVSAYVFTGDGNDNVDVTWPLATSIWAGTGDDVLAGSPKNDLLNGEDGNDTIDGRLGENYMNGDGGNDRLVQSTKVGSDSLSGGAGTDEVDYSIATTPVNVTFDGDWNDGIQGEQDNVLSDVETVIGGAGADVLTGTADPQTLDGRGGNDLLDLRDGGDDVGRCGDGVDRVLADVSPKDANLTACETITRG